MSKEHTTEHLRAELKSLSDTLEEVLSSSGENRKRGVRFVAKRSRH